jgi:hydroxymethylpyrimidine pyrophosphatase-like HAD family hydrolase
MGYRLIAVDVDGTLLRSDGTISERTRNALRTATDRGVAVAVATGRRRTTALPIMRMLDVPHFLVASQGAVTWLDDEIISHAHLPLESALKAVAITDELGMCAMVFGNALHPETLWISGDWRSNARVAAYVERAPEKGGFPTVRELTPNVLEHDPIQLIVFDTMERLEALNERLTGHAPPPPSLDPPPQDGPEGPRHLWRIIFSKNQFTAGGAIEIVGPDTSKAHALQVLCDRLGCTRADVVAFGDNVNDLEMLAFAGLGVCMGNGTNEAKALADRIGPTNDEDGIAAVLEELGIA